MRVTVTKPQVGEMTKTFLLHEKMCWCKNRYHRCSKARRDGHLTCWWHRRHEDEAQAKNNQEDE